MAPQKIAEDGNLPRHGSTISQITEYRHRRPPPRPWTTVRCTNVAPRPPGGPGIPKYRGKRDARCLGMRRRLAGLFLRFSQDHLNQTRRYQGLGEGRATGNGSGSTGKEEDEPAHKLLALHHSQQVSFCVDDGHGVKLK